MTSKIAKNAYIWKLCIIYPQRKFITQFFRRCWSWSYQAKIPHNSAYSSGQLLIQTVVIVDTKLPIWSGTKIQTKSCSYGIKTGPKCHLPSSLAVFWTRSNISAFSSAANRLGTSPAANHNFDNQSDSGDQPQPQLHLQPTTTLTINLTRMTNGNLKIWMSCWYFFWTCRKNHADVF